MGEQEFRKSLEDIIKPEGIGEWILDKARWAVPIGVAGLTAVLANIYYDFNTVADCALAFATSSASQILVDSAYSRYIIQPVEGLDVSREVLPAGFADDLETRLEDKSTNKESALKRSIAAGAVAGTGLYLLAQHKWPNVFASSDLRTIAGLTMFIWGSASVYYRATAGKQVSKGTKDSWLWYTASSLEKFRLKGLAKRLHKHIAEKHNLKDTKDISAEDLVTSSSAALSGGNLYKSLVYNLGALWLYQNSADKIKPGLGHGTSLYMSMLRRRIRSGLDPHLAAIDMANLYFMTGKQEKSEKVWQVLKEHYPDDMGVQLYNSIRMMYLKKDDEAREGFISLLSSFDRRGFTYETIGEYRNEVLRCKVDSSDAEAIGSLLFFKKSKNPENLRREHRNLDYFNRHFRGKITQPVVLSGKDEDIVSVMFSAGKNNLFQRIIEQDCDEKEKKRLLYDAAEFLADIHVKGNEAKEELELEDVIDEGYFTERVNSVFVDQSRDHGVEYELDDVNMLLQNYHIIEDRLSGMEKDFYKDANLMNWIDSKLGIQAIDFEGDKVLPCQLDLVSLLEFGEDYLAEDNVEEALDRYISRKQESTESQIDRESFMKDYHYAAVQRHIELAGYRIRDVSTGQNEEWSRKAAPYHLRKAAFHSDKLSLYEKLEGNNSNTIALDKVRESLVKLSKSYGHKGSVHVPDTDQEHMEV